jgi:hypothetical protein
LWKERRKFALKNGDKSLNGYCLDIYSAWCEEKYNFPFYLFLSPQDVGHYSKNFARTSLREFCITHNGHYTDKGHDRIFVNEGLSRTDRIEGHSPPGTGEGLHKNWDYTTFLVRWMLVFEVWKNEKLTDGIRNGLIRELVIARKDGYPFRVSFDFSGTVLDFIDQSLQQYNGKEVKGYISGSSTIAVSL